MGLCLLTEERVGSGEQTPLNMKPSMSYEHFSHCSSKWPACWLSTVLPHPEAHNQRSHTGAKKGDPQKVTASGNLPCLVAHQ